MEAVLTPPAGLPAVGVTGPHAARAAAAARRSPAPLRFRPSAWSTLLLGAVLPVFLSLADWQWQKAERKAAAQAEREAGSVGPLFALPATPVADPESWRHRRVTLRGEFVAAGQILLDNQIQQGQPGLHVLTPLRLDGSGLHVLVDRGWMPLPADRRHMPAPVVPPGPVELTGSVHLPATKVFRLAPENAGDARNALWQTIDLERYSRVTRLPLQPVVVRLDGEAPHGFRRDWPRLDERHERHRSYALQWLGFALASVGIWLWFALRRAPAAGARKDSR